MKLLVSGRYGQVARSIAERAPHHGGFNLIFAARPETDLAIPGSLAKAIAHHRPDVVINAAAYTAVDKAESDEETATRVNGLAAGEGAKAAARIGARFVQISTDYVFDGLSDRPWREGDTVAPLNAYGRGKALGEALVLGASDEGLIVRTSWVISPFGLNFVKTMLRLAQERNEIAVVDDQRGSPSSALDLADALLEIISASARGIYHVAGSGSATWADLAERAMHVSRSYGGPSATIRRIASSGFATKAPRPVYSVLDCSKATQELGIALPPWRDSLAVIVERILAER